MNNLEHLTGEDILYDPRSDTYKVRVGDRTVEVPSSSLRHENLDVLKNALDRTDDAFRKIYLGDWAEAARAKTATEAEEAARAGQVPLAAADRYPSIPYRSVIEDAIELLNKNKKLHLHKVSFYRNGLYYILTVSSRGHTALGKTPVRTVKVSINLATFDRMLKTELDREAGLKASLDTNTYIKLRIAFLLYKALSMNDDEARKFWMVGIFSVLDSSTRHDFSF